MIRARMQLVLACLALSLAPVVVCAAVAPLPASLQARIAKLTQDALAKSGVPSASIAVIRNGELEYVQAFGDARLDPKTAATTSMRYSVGSISKQFTAAALLILQQQGKLSLDDKVAKYFPDLTDADRISLRQLLSHTSGYQDFWPQDYVMPPMLKPTTPQYIMDTWAKKPLDFAPGDQWQYSNTNYLIAGEIVRKLTGQTPFAFLQQHVFGPLGMASVYDSNLSALPDTDPRGYRRYALGPLHPAPKEGVNWMYAAGELSMTPADLAKWDIAMLQQKLLQPASWRDMETEVRLNNGLGSDYGLGVRVGQSKGHRMISHGGEVSGFTATNLVFPDDGIAVVVLTNQDAVGTSGEIANHVAEAVFDVHDVAADRALEQARAIFAGLQRGQLDRSLFTANANSYFDATALHDYRVSLAPLGKPDSFKISSARKRGGMQMRAYTATFGDRKLWISTYALPDGKLEQFIVSPGG